MHKIISMTTKFQDNDPDSLEKEFQTALLNDTANYGQLSTGGGGGQSRRLNNIFIKFDYKESEHIGNLLMHHLNEIVPTTTKHTLTHLDAQTLIALEQEAIDLESASEYDGNILLKQLASISETDGHSVLLVAYLKNVVNLLEAFEDKLLNNEQHKTLISQLARIAVKDFLLANKDRVGLIAYKKLIAHPNYGNILVEIRNKNQYTKTIICIDNDAILTKMEEMAGFPLYFEEKSKEDFISDLEHLLRNEFLKDINLDIDKPTFKHLIDMGINQATSDIQQFLDAYKTQPNIQGIDIEKYHQSLEILLKSFKEMLAK